MKISYLDFLKKKTPLQSVYLISGEEDFFRQEAVDKIKKTLLEKKGEEASVIEFSGDGNTNKLQPADILDELKTQSMFTSHKIVVFRRAKKFMQEYDSSLLQYIEDPVDFSTLIFSTPDFDFRRKLAKAIKKKGVIVECGKLYDKPPPWQPHKPLYESDLCQWIVTRIRQKGKSITAPDAYLFIEQLGSEVGKIAQAIESLLIFTRGKKKIEGEDIRNLLGLSKKSTSFDYRDCLIQKDLKGALEALENMLREGLPDGKGDTISPPQVIATILVSTVYRKFHKIWEALTLRKRGLSFKDISQRLKVRKFLQTKFKGELAAFRLEDLPHLLRLLGEAEKKLKSSQGSPREVLEDMTLRICLRDRSLETC